MLIDGKHYWLSDHGRDRYIERICDGVCTESDGQIITNAVAGVPGFVFVWKPDGKNPKGKRLVTVMLKEDYQNVY